jgi:hypothetical protein
MEPLEIAVALVAFAFFALLVWVSDFAITNKRQLWGKDEQRHSDH